LFERGKALAITVVPWHFMGQLAKSLHALVESCPTTFLTFYPFQVSAPIALELFLPSHLKMTSRSSIPTWLEFSLVRWLEKPSGQSSSKRLLMRWFQKGTDGRIIKRCLISEHCNARRSLGAKAARCDDHANGQDRRGRCQIQHVAVRGPLGRNLVLKGRIASSEVSSSDLREEKIVRNLN
jgi:hypothetical protein